MAKLPHARPRPVSQPSTASILVTLADAERAVADLPFEGLLVGERLVNPLRGISLEELHGVRNFECGRQRNQKMHMILDAAGLNDLHFVIPGDAAEVGPEPDLHVGGDQRATVLRRENHVQ